ncbi:DNA-3-methyladenine glycosylase 2 family protein [Halogeometricum sp. S1BR25-6]|uniref:DNA-3-methyladenine glycosylase 2 family protein n=1 Tax=Halogeometricum salsisoli TaxID=2950536 RepID=A0ABU2GG53_9EURY|nr:DNA-3-methyladenine glycosylase 2 family protein [Halogeometricum sp. S1BR25-6]MDS0299154.1 DNA-3-methyladenine glycosylase 2 family protein [Halogeometricum sp. S1BR25-6]
MTDDADSVLREDPVMRRVMDRRDPYTEREWTPFERIVVAIAYQSVSTASAAAVTERVFETLDGEVTPERVLETDESALREAGLSGRKVEYVRNAARAFRESDFSRETLADYSDEEVVETLTEISGIGEWTAEMFLLFVLGRDDVLPLGDLAVRRGIEDLYGEGKRDGEDGELTRAEMRDIAERWRPYRSLATRYVWADYMADEG